MGGFCKGTVAGHGGKMMATSCPNMGSSQTLIVWAYLSSRSQIETRLPIIHFSSISSVLVLSHARRFGHRAAVPGCSTHWRHGAETAPQPVGELGAGSWGLRA